MTTDAPKTLVTGFEPFTTGQGVRLTHNPTADVVIQLKNQLPTVNIDVLPVSYSATRLKLTTLFSEFKPTVWIGLGYAHHRTTLDIEVIALNMEHAVGGDNDGDQPFIRPIIADAPAALQTRLDIEECIKIFRAHNVEARPSFHAGTFLCNQTFYLGCHAAETTGTPLLAGFIHVPPMQCNDAFVEGLKTLVETLSETCSSS